MCQTKSIAIAMASQGFSFACLARLTLVLATRPTLSTAVAIRYTKKPIAPVKPAMPHTLPAAMENTIREKKMDLSLYFTFSGLRSSLFTAMSAAAAIAALEAGIDVDVDVDADADDDALW